MAAAPTTQHSSPPIVPAGRRAMRQRVGPGVIASVIAHIAVFGGALIWARLAAPRVIARPPIVARLVQLGAPRDPSLLPQLPSRSTAPTRKVRVDPQEAAPSPQNAKAAATEESAPTARSAAASRMAEALDRQQRLRAAMDNAGAHKEPPAGRADGDRDGTAEDAAEGDRYLGLITEALRRSYVLPSAISEKERMRVSCTFFIRIGPRGKVTESRIQDSSGNPLIDRAIESGLARLVLPPPPTSFLLQYRDGVEIRYKP